MKKLIFGLFLLVFALSFVSPAQVQTNINSLQGFQVFYPDYDYVKANTSFYLHIHVSNLSNGVQLGNGQYDCRVHLYNQLGQHTFESQKLNNDANGYDKELYIDAGNFTDLGQHAFYIWCYTAYFGGEARGTYEVTQTGTELTTAKAILYIIVIFLIITLLTLCLIGGSRISIKNQRNMEGEVINVNWKKYLKIFCFAMAYLMLIAFVFIMFNLTWAYLDYTGISTFLHFLYRLLIAFSLPVLLGTIIMTLIKYLNDKKISKFLTRTGLPFNG